MELHKDGKSNRKISEALGIGSSTVDEFIKALPGNSIVKNPGTQRPPQSSTWLTPKTVQKPSPVSSRSPKASTKS